MLKNGIVAIILLLVVIGAVVLGKTTLPKTLTKIQPQISPGPTQVTKPTCSPLVGAFTTSPTDIDKIRVVSPGKLVGDARFTYLWIKDAQRVPIFAPADGTLIKIIYKTRVDLPPGMSMPDYDLLFMVDCKTIYRINHITDPNPDIAALKPITQVLRIGKGLPAPSEADTTPTNNLMVKAGQQLGTTTGTPAAHNFDLGLFIDQVSVCPYDKFNEPIRSAWLALMGDTSKPIAGTRCEVSGAHL